VKTGKSQPETVSLTVGTAGHIDHGKTELIKYLTGCDTDRLPEEKARGMSIDLGFATCTLPDNRRVGIVDVPGHERFIHNMVAGAAGIDVVLLVVAADDGVMPQTLEHFHIVRLLGVSSGMVAITKIDLVDETRPAEVAAQVHELTAGSFLEDCPVVNVSSKTGQGFEDFYDAFTATVNKTAERDDSGPFRLHVERSFTLKGLGTVVSGIPRSGFVNAGGAVELLPAGRTVKVRGIQVYGADSERGRAGECVALNIPDLSRDEAARGTVLAEPGHYRPARFVNAWLSLLPTIGKPIKPRTAVRLHVGTSDVPGHLVLPSLDALRPGGSSYVQVQLKKPIVAAPGDFFVLRILSPVRTVGGGHVVSSGEAKMRRTKGNWIEECEEHERAFRDPLTAIEYVVQRAGDTPLKTSEIARQAILNTEAAGVYAGRLLEDGRLVSLPGGRYVHAEIIAETREGIIAAMNSLHDESPMSIGFTRKELFPLLSGDRHLVEAALVQLLEAGTLLQSGNALQIPARAPRLSERQSAVAEKIATIYRDSQFASPRKDELPELLGVPGPIIDPVMTFLLETGELVAVDAKVVFHKDSVELARRKLVEYLQAHERIEAGTFKNLVDTTRKYAIPLLEYWDRKGLTRRVGDARVLRET